MCNKKCKYFKLLNCLRTVLAGQRCIYCKIIIYRRTRTDGRRNFLFGKFKLSFIRLVATVRAQWLLCNYRLLLLLRSESRSTGRSDSEFK